MCHPHPLHGGSMDNNVVVAVTFGLADAGIASLRFNFRGVGNSQGQHAKGEKEHEEALVAMDFLGALPDVNDDRIGLGGYSFSTRVICSHKQLVQEAQGHRAGCAFPGGHHRQPAAAGQDPSRMIITGDRDRLVNSEGVDEQLGKFDPPADYHVVAGADHFWVGQ